MPLPLLPHPEVPNVAYGNPQTASMVLPKSPRKEPDIEVVPQSGGCHQHCKDPNHHNGAHQVQTAWSCGNGCYGCLTVKASMLVNDRASSFVSRALYGLLRLPETQQNHGLPGFLNSGPGQKQPRLHTLISFHPPKTALKSTAYLFRNHLLRWGRS